MFVMAVADVAVLINCDTNSSLKLFADQIFKSSNLPFLLSDGAEFGEQFKASISTIEYHYTLCEVDRSVAGLQTCNQVVCSRTEMTLYA